LSFKDHRIDLNLIHYADQLTTKSTGDKTLIKDPVRKQFFILQPEELVRQLLIHFLIHDRQWSISRLQVEKSISVNGLLRRFDIVIYDKVVKPFILVECKAPDIPINQATFDQVAAYNHALNAPYIIITNGQETYCATISNEKDGYQFLGEIPMGKDIGTNLTYS
jgi:hypothetical protein